jgi:aryl-alcohol dehydrogenase-like predicted oxidoreductase
MYPVPCMDKWFSRSEEIIGSWLAGRTDRSSLVIATKVVGPRAGGQHMVCPSRERALGGDPAAAPAEAELSHAQIVRACDASLARLRTPYIDLYQIHWPERYVPKWGESQYKAGKAAEDQSRETAALQGFDAVVRSMGVLLDQGKIKAWGLSNETSFGVGAFAAACARLGVAPPVSIQNDFSLCFRTFEGELAETCAPQHHNLGLLAYGVLNGGVLSGKYLGARHPALANAANAAAPPAAEPRARFNFIKSAEVAMPNFQGRYNKERCIAATEEYVALASRLGTDGATLAQAWAYSRHYMGAVIIGATSVAQLEANWAAATFVLSPEALAEIDEIHCRHRNPNLQD